MKTLSKILGVAIIAVTMTACGSNNNNAAANAALAAQAAAGVNTGLYGAGGCVPVQSGSFSFTAQGAYMNIASLYAGMIPANGTRPGQYGQVVMGGAIGTNLGGSMIQYSPKQSQNGTIQLSASMQSATTGIASGMITINPSIIQSLVQSMGYMNGQYTAANYASTACVSSIALDVVQTVNMATNIFNTGSINTFNQPSYGYINQALVYLYMNSGIPVGPIAF